MSEQEAKPSVLGVQVTPLLLIRRILQGFFTYVLLRAKGLIILPLLTRLLGPEGMGILALSGATANLVWPLVVLGLHTGLAVQSVHLKSREELRRAYSSVSLITLVTALVSGGAVAVFIALFGPSVGLAKLRPYALAVAAYVITAGLKEVAVTIPQISQRTTLTSALNLTVEFGRTALAIVLVIGGSGPGGAIWSDALAYLVGAVWATIFTVRQLGFRFSIDWGLLRSCLAVALPILPVSAGQWVLQALDSYFLSFYHGDVAVGVYSVAYTLASLVLAINAVLNFIFFPSAGALYRQGLDRLVKFTSQTLRLSSFLLGLACVGSALLAPWGVWFLAGEDYSGAVAVIPWVVAGYAAWTLTLVLQAVPMIVERRSQPVAWTYAVTTVLNVALNILLIPRGQLVGAAVATMVSYTVGLILMSQVAWGLAPGLRDWGSLLTPWLPALLLMPLAFRFPSLPNAPLWDPMGRVVLLVGLYLGLGLVLGIVRSSDLQVLRTRGGQ